MFAPCIRSLARPASTRASQCLRRPRMEAIPKYTTPCRMQQKRFQSKPTFRTTAKALFKAHPYQLSLATIIILFGAGGLVYVNYFYANYIIGAFIQYPEPVAKQMRKALYYTNISLEPKLAVKYYKEALRVADELRLDPFSDPIMGIKIQIAELMERIQQYQNAIGVLEIVKSDNLKWIEAFGNRPGLEGNRNRILKKTIQVSVKLGELYSNDYVMEFERAEESLSWAVENTLREQKRRETEGTKEGEGEWMTPEEIGGSMERLGHHYEERNRHDFAAPLFLQALTMSPPKSCHTVVLMNNLSISIAQQSPPLTAGQPPVSRDALIGNAKLWAEKAVALAATIAPPDRNEECDSGCAVATHNLGEFAEMAGNIEEALKRFNEAKSLAKAIGFQEGVQNAEDALIRLQKM